MANPRMRFKPGDTDAARGTIRQLADRFAAWKRSGDAGSVVDVSDLELLLEWKVGWADARLDEWTRADVEGFLLDWCPRKLSVPADNAFDMAERVAEAFSFLGEEGLLSRRGETGPVLAEHVRALAPQFREEMGDPANFGMAKRLLGGLGALGGGEVTQEGLDRLMDEFNALPYEQRKALTDPLPDPEPSPPRIGPVVLPDEADIRASAAAAPVLAGLVALSDFFAPPGRPLTAKGNIKLADAQALSEIIGSESVEESVGEHTFRRQSSANMPALDHWQWWARQVGAIRVAKGRMIGVKAWRERCARDPLAEATKAFEVLMSHGVIGSYLVHMPMPGVDLVDTVAPSLLGIVLGAPEPVEFSTLVDIVTTARERTGVRPYFDDPEFTRWEVRRDVDRMLIMLERAGVVVQNDPTYEPARFREIRSGGTVELTPFGIVMAVDQARGAGMTVDVVEAPTGAEDLVDLAISQTIDIDSWIGLLASWVEDQADPQRALEEVLEALEPGTLMMVLAAGVPDSLGDLMATVLDRIMSSRDREDPLAAVAYGWLVAHDRLDPTQVNPETDRLSRFIALGLLAAAEPQAVPETMGLDRSQQELLVEVADLARLMPPRVEATLEAIGRHHPDKVVAKSGRRELLRVRSRLANQRG